MSTELLTDLPTAIWDLQDMLTASSVGPKGNLWEELVKHCKDGAVDHKFVKPVEDQIPKYIETLSDPEKRKIWSETETGVLNIQDAETWEIEDIELDLQNELLAEVLKQAFLEAEAMKQERQRRRRTRS